MRDFIPQSHELELEITGAITLGGPYGELVAPRCRYLLKIGAEQAHLLWLLDPGNSDPQVLGLPETQGEPLLLRAKSEVLEAHREWLLKTETPEDLLGIGGGILLNPESYEALGPLAWERDLARLLPLNG